MLGYDISHETHYYDSFSYKSELRVLKDMALIDLLALDQDHIGMQLLQLKKVEERFKQLWEHYHDNHYGYLASRYNASYPFSIRIKDLFIVNNLQPDHAEIAVTEKFVDDLAESIKLRELFLKELIREVSPEIEETKDIPLPDKVPVDELKPEVPQPVADLPAKPVSRYPTFTKGTAIQFFKILQPYFTDEDHLKLSNLLSKNSNPDSPLIFRGNGNQLADAFKQLYDANLIVGCMQIDLEKWIAPKFLYLSYQGEPREFTDGYLNGLISTRTRPCKSPILKVERKEVGFLILPVPRNKK